MLAYFSCFDLADLNGRLGFLAEAWPAIIHAMRVIKDPTKVDIAAARRKLRAVSPRVLIDASRSNSGMGPDITPPERVTHPDIPTRSGAFVAVGCVSMCKPSYAS